MLIDSNAYTGHWPFRQLQGNDCQALTERMKRFGVSKSVVSSLNGIFYKDTQRANIELYNDISSNNRFKDQLIPFAVINPVYNGWRDDLENSAKRLGMKGVRLHPAYHRYSLANPECIELVKRARDLGLPVALSLRMVDRRPSSWLDIKDEWSLKDVAPIVKAVPDAKYLILNLANSTELDAESTQLFRNSDIIMDTSGRNVSDLGGLIKTFGHNKFAMGTHSPILDYFTGILRVESLRPAEADEQTKEMIRSGNLKRFLGI